MFSPARAPAGTTWKWNGWKQGNFLAGSCWHPSGAELYLLIEWEREANMDWLGLLIPVKLAVFCLIIVLVLRSSGSWWCVHLLRSGSIRCSHSCCLDPETPKLLEGPIPKSRMATFQVYAPGAPGGKTVMIYHNKKKWFGSAQYRNGVIHKIFINVLGRPRLVWYNKDISKSR